MAGPSWPGRRSSPTSAGPLSSWCLQWPGLRTRSARKEPEWGPSWPSRSTSTSWSGWSTRRSLTGRPLRGWVSARDALAAPHSHRRHPDQFAPCVTDEEGVGRIVPRFEDADRLTHVAVGQLELERHAPSNVLRRHRVLPRRHRWNGTHGQPGPQLDRTARPQAIRTKIGRVLETGPRRAESTCVADQPGPPLSHYAKVTVVVIAVLALLRAAWAVRNILLLVLVAAVLAIGLDPAVRRLQRLNLPRGWAVFLIMLATVGFVALFSILVIPPVVRGVRQLALDIPGYVDRLQRENTWFRDLARKYDLSTKLRSLTDRLPSLASASLGKILGITRSVASVIFNLLTILILTIYFLMALHRGERTAERLMSGEHRRRNVLIFQEALDRVGGYVSGNLAISVIAGIASFVFLRIVGVPFAAALAMWVAIADLIPTVGATLGALAAVIVAFFSSVGDGIVTIIFFLAYQQVENYVIVPRVMRKAVDLTPAAVIVSVLIGGSLAGFAGALLALPLAAAAKVVIRDVWLGPRTQAVTTPPPPMPPPGTTEVEPTG